MKPDNEERYSFKLVVLFALISSIAQVSNNLTLPLIYEIGAALNTDAASVQFSITLFLIGFGITQFISGLLLDQYATKIVIGLSFCLFVSASIWAATTNDETSFLIARFLQGCGGGSGISVARYQARSFYAGDRLDRFLAAINAVFVLFPAVAPSIGALLGDLIGWRTIFWVQACFGAALATAFMMLALPVQQKTDTQSIQALISALEKWRATFGYAIAGGLAYSIFYLTIFESPRIVIGDFNLTPHHHGASALILLGAFMAGGIFVSTQRFLSFRRLARIGLVLCVLASFCLVALHFVGALSLPAYVFFGAAALVGAGIFFPVSVSRYLGEFTKEAGAATAIMGLIHTLMIVFFTALLNELTPRITANVLVLNFCAAMMATALYVVLAPGRDEKSTGKHARLLFAQLFKAQKKRGS